MEETGISARKTAVSVVKLISSWYALSKQTTINHQLLLLNTGTNLDLQDQWHLNLALRSIHSPHIGDA
jgi:hypothetical protein